VIKSQANSKITYSTNVKESAFIYLSRNITSNKMFKKRKRRLFDNELKRTTILLKGETCADPR